MTNDITKTGPIAPVYRYYVEDLISGKKLAELDFRGVSYKLALNAAGEFSGSLVVRESNAVDLYSATLPGVTALYILRNDECVWGGIIWEREYVPDDKKLTVSASEFTSYLHHRKIWKTWNHEFGGSVTWRSRWDAPLSTELVNWTRNPQPRSSGSEDEWLTRYSWTRTHSASGGPFGTFPYFRWTAPSSQTSNGRGWDVYGNRDLATPGTDNTWKRLPVKAGNPMTVNLYVRSSRAVSYNLLGRYHDGAGNWIGAAFNFGYTATVPGGTWTQLSGVTTPPANGYLVFGMSIGNEVTFAAGDTFDGSRVFVGQGTYTPDAYVDGDEGIQGNVRAYWENSPGESRSVRERSAALTDGFVATFDYGSNVNVRPGSTVKLEFYEVENFKYNGYYRVEASPAPSKERFYIYGGSSVADLSMIEYTGTQAIVYTKENHGFYDGDVISIAISMEGETEYTGPLSYTDVKISAPGGANSNMFSFTNSTPASKILVEGVAMRPLPKADYSKVTIGVRQDTYDYVRSLVEGTFNDFVGTDFPNEYITPGISRGLDIISKKSFEGHSVLKTAGDHGIAVGQAVQIQDVGPEFDGEFEVTAIEGGDSIVYVNSGDVPETPVSITNVVVSEVQQNNGMATLKTTAAHGLKAGQNIVLDMGIRYPDLTGTFKIYDLPDASTFRIYTGSTTNYVPAVLTDSTATVGGNTRKVVSSQMQSNVATLKTDVPHGFSVGNSVTVTGASRSIKVIEKSLDGPSGTAYIQTDGPHGLLTGGTVVLSGLSDSFEVVRAESSTSSTKFTTSAPHNLKPGDSVAITGQDTFNIMEKSIQSNVASLATNAPHNIPVGGTFTVTGLYDNYIITRFVLSNGNATYTTSGLHNVKVNDEIVVSGLSDSYSVITKAAVDGLVTLTMSRPHNLHEDQKIRVAGLGLPFDGEVTVSTFTDQRITYKVDSKHIDYEIAEAARRGQKLSVPLTVPEQKTTGTVSTVESYMNGTWRAASVTGNTITVARAGNNYPASNVPGGMLSALSHLNGTYTAATGTSWYNINFAKTANDSTRVTVPQPVKDDDTPALVSAPTVYGTNRTITSVTANTFRANIPISVAVDRNVSLFVSKNSAFNGTRTVTSVTAKDRFTFAMSGYSFSMLEMEQGAPSMGWATGIFNGTYTITAVDPVNNAFSYSRAYQNLPEQEVQNRGTGAVYPLAIASTFGPFPGNADLQFVFPDNEYSGINIQPALYRGFELKSVGDALDEYASNINGFEYRIDCEFIPEEDRFIKKFVLLPINFPNPPEDGEASPLSRFGADKLVFEYPAGSVSTFSIRESAEEAATRFFALGESTLGPDVGPYIGVAASEELLRGERDGRRWPLLDASDTVDGIDDKVVLHSYAKRFLSELQPPFASFQISVNGSRPPYVGTYKPGDWCSIVVNDPWMQMRLASDLEPRNDVIVRKIDSISISVPDGVTYPETVTVNLVAEWEVDKRG